MLLRWKYSDDSATQAVFYEGEISYYGSGGYYFNFPQYKSQARKFIADLEYNTWLDRGTRAVFVDFSIYNCNINIVCVGKYGRFSIFALSFFFVVRVHSPKFCYDVYIFSVRINNFPSKNPAPIEKLQRSLL